MAEIKKDTNTSMEMVIATANGKHESLFQHDQHAPAKILSKTRKIFANILFGFACTFWKYLLHHPVYSLHMMKIQLKNG